MKTQSNPPQRLTAYLSIGLGAGVLGTPSVMLADNPIVTVPSQDISDLNNVTDGGSGDFSSGFGGGTLYLNNNSSGIGFQVFAPDGVMAIAFKGVNNTSPYNFSYGQTIGSSGPEGWSPGGSHETEFQYYGNVSPAFGPGSYLGFRNTAGDYGWLEVTWDPTTKAMNFIAGAYNTDAGVSIGAGEVPEPGTLALLTTGAAGLLALRRRRAA